jgi:hypothetical protein
MDAWNFLKKKKKKKKKNVERIKATIFQPRKAEQCFQSYPAVLLGTSQHDGLHKGELRRQSSLYETPLVDAALSLHFLSPKCVSSMQRFYIMALAAN